jgi:enoyl-[acyl-carrier protein] reductase I
MGFLAGKRALIVGVATERSIAWGIAQAMHREGAELAFTYLNDKLKERVVPLAESLGSKLVMPMDVTVDAQIDAGFDLLKREWGNLDIVVHAVAHAPREALMGGFVESTSREAFRSAHDVSAYSFVALAKRAVPLMEGRAGALLTLSYLGAVRSIPNYNVMGVAKASLESAVRYLANDLGPGRIRVNAISAGPVKTASARAVKDFSSILDQVKERSPLRHITEPGEVGDTAVFLASDLSRGLTGNVLFVDSGMHLL